MDKVTELARRLEPFTLRMIRDVIGAQNATGTGGSQFNILLYDVSATKIRSFSATDAGFVAALAAASSGDIVLVPAMIVAGNHTIISGVEVTGVGIRSTLSGAITVNSNGALSNVYVSGTLVSSGYTFNVRYYSGTFLGGNALNVANNAPYCFAGGQANTIGGGVLATAIFGSGNETSSRYSIIAGHNHEDAGGGWSAIFGQTHVITNDGTHQLIAGDSHTIDGSAIIVAGKDNTVNGNCFGNAVFGYSNVVAGDYNAVFGSTNTVAANNVLCFGVQGSVTHNGVMMLTDSSAFAFASAVANELAVRATGGVRFVTAIDGAGAATITATIDATGNLVIPGDLTVTGDDIILATNTANYFLMADGTNYNPTSPADARTGLDVYSTAEADEHTIHDNVAAEISAVTTKATPVAGDYVLGEDSAAAFAKKKFDVASLIGGGDNPFWYIDGALATGTEIGIAYVAGDILTIEAVYIHCKDPGTASSTIVDVNKNGTTIFTNQANRPELAFDDADGIAKSGTPDVTGLVELDVLTIDIDQVATGAGSISVVVVFTGGGGGGGGGGDSTFTDVYASKPAASNDGDLFLPSDGFSLERDTGTAWVPWGPLFPLTAPPTTGWSWVNQGAATVDVTKGGIYLTAPAIAGYNFRIRERAITEPYIVTAAFSPNLYPVNGTAFGFILRQSSDGKLILFSVYFYNGWNLVGSQWANPTTWSGGLFTRGYLITSPMWLQIEDDSTNRIYRVSYDGQNFQQIYSEARTTFLTADQIGFAANAYHATQDAAGLLLSWKEE